MMVKKIRLKENLPVFLAAIVMVMIIGFLIWNTVSKEFIDEQELVTFDNTDLEMSIKNYLGVETITIQDANQIECLEINGAGVLEDLHELKPFKNIKRLYMYNCELSSLDGIQGFLNLERLICNKTQLKDVSALADAQLENLRYLNLNENDIKEFSNIIYNLGALEALFLEDCNLKGEINLGNSNSLTELSLNNNEIEKISAHLPNIKIISVTHNQITNISTFLNFDTLEELWISENPISSIKGISRLAQLELLAIEDTDIEDISELRSISTFNSIYLDRNYDRESIVFMQDNFKNGDMYTKQYILSIRHDLKIRGNGDNK